MAPNLFGNSATLFLEASQNVSQDKADVKNTTPKAAVSSDKLQNKSKYKWNIVWRNVIAFVYLHAGFLYGLYLLITGARILTFLWGKFIYFYKFSLLPN